MEFTSNPQLDLAFEYVRNTNKNIFLTGKAGTGKTTFLHKIKEEGCKRLVVTAPTGVAAINAGGMTLHSFFQLPFGLHLPDATREAPHRFSRDKINLIRTLDLLVIDEISMVRADLLDAVDEVLRRHRDHARPFGGVQLLMIGDLHQLPPVVKADEWALLRPHYATPYFFESLALRRAGMVAIELKHIFRQSDSRFIALLNKVRNNRLDATVLATLNSRYIDDFQPPEDDDYITLTSHNASAQNLNTERLKSLAGHSRVFKAKTEGEFPQTAYPTEEILEFKTGAQVMFIKNDLSADKRYFNGKIGKIARFSGGEIFVSCKGEPDDIAVAPAEWQNIRYSLDEQTKEIKEDLLGTFTQYPLKLAWAITIHKSQGLTFDRAIIDGRAAFAHGQVYVALSRCRTFEGIVLSSKLNLSSVKTDSAVKSYGDEMERRAPDEGHLRESKREYQQALIRELFEFRAMERYLQQLSQLFREHNNALSTEGLQGFKALVTKAGAEIFSIADKFSPRLQDYFAQPELPSDNEKLGQRLRSASDYFRPKLNAELLAEITNINLITDDKAVLKAAQQHLHNLQKEIFTKCACFAACRDGFSSAAYTRAKTDAELDVIRARRTIATAPAAVPKGVSHPELYARLLHWRSETAETLGMEPRKVLRTRSLEDLVHFLPTNMASLTRIQRIGTARARRFGPAIISIIDLYCSERNVVAKTTSLPEPPEADTKRISFDLYKSGKTVEEIAVLRGLKPVTIEGHLAYFIGRRELEISRFLEAHQVNEIAGFCKQTGALSTGGPKAYFGDKYSHGQLKMVLEYLKATAE